MTELQATTTPVSTVTGCLVVGVVRDREGLTIARQAEALGAGLPDLLERFGATEAEGRVARLPAPAGLAADLVVTVGLGDAPADGRYDAEVLRRAAAPPPAP